MDDLFKLIKFSCVFAVSNVTAYMGEIFYFSLIHLTAVVANHLAAVIIHKIYDDLIKYSTSLWVNPAP